MYIKYQQIFSRELKNRRKFAIYNFDDKINQLLLSQKYQLVKLFDVDTYLDRKSYVMNFYHNFLSPLDKGECGDISLEDIRIFQMHVAKTGDYYDKVLDIVQRISNIDKISFDLLRLSRVREEYCITDKVAQEFDQILNFFLSISDEIPEYIKYFQIQGVKFLLPIFEFLQS
mmetsp:Transcript_31807/g.28166  ORF Transcript_31807/g.28166 Transcript_31807/m.28166 type:complete len:172 (+) Transcript_31807:98-613(+)